MQSEVTQLIQQNQILEARSLAEIWVLDSDHDRLLALQYAGMTQLFCGDALAAEQSFRSALAIEPDLPRNLANLGIALMTQGRYAEGLALYEARYAQGIHATDKVSFTGMDPLKQWRGERLDGKCILLVGEQGFGDHFQFIRFASELRAAGAAKVMAHVRPELADLLSTAPDVDAIFCESPSPEAYDLWCPLLSSLLCLHLPCAQQPTHTPYLWAPPNRVLAWQQQMAAWVQNKPKIGLVWAGSPGNSVDARRSLSTDQMLTLVESCKKWAFFSLQLGHAGMDALNVQCANGIIPLLDLLTDFTETAAVIANLDLVISVDTAVAHLAAAMGKTVWLLLPAGPDWRWGLNETTTPWYPSMRIFRQSVTGNWSGVLQSVCAALQAKFNPNLADHSTLTA